MIQITVEMDLNKCFEKRKEKVSGPEELRTQISSAGKRQVDDFYNRCTQYRFIWIIQSLVPVLLLHVNPNTTNKFYSFIVPCVSPFSP